MNEKIMYYARKPLVYAGQIATFAAGGIFGAGAMYIYKKRVVAQNINTVIEELKSEHAYERAERERTFNIAIQEAVDFTCELRKLGVTVFSNVEGLSLDERPEIVVERIVQPTNIIGTVSSVTQNEETGIISAEDVHTFNKGVERNIFDETNDVWDYELERQIRTKETPYIIHADEFQADEMGWDSQTALTWYEGDQILTDTHDVPIYNPHTVIGEPRFGHGSGDSNVVYIRNERLQAEYEVIRDPGSYEEIVLGGSDTIEEEYIQVDLKHSRSPSKFRGD